MTPDGIHPDAGIADRHQNLLVFTSLGFDEQLTLLVHILHRIDPIEHKVHEDLLQLHVVTYKLRQR